MRDKGLSELNIQFLVRFGMGCALNMGMNKTDKDKTREECREWLERSHSLLSDTALEKARQVFELRELIKRLYG